MSSQEAGKNERRWEANEGQGREGESKGRSRGGSRIGRRVGLGWVDWGSTSWIGVGVRIGLGLGIRMWFLNSIASE